MSWTKKAKPSSQNWQAINFDPTALIPAQFGIAEFGFSEFGKVTNVQPANWTKKTKPSIRSWTKRAKPTS